MGFGQEIPGKVQTKSMRCAKMGQLTWLRQACNTSTKSWLAPLLRDALIPEFVQRLTKSATSCDALIIQVFLVESLLWCSLVSMLSRAGQKQYLGVVGLTTIGTLCSSIVVRDPATLLLVVAPLWTDLAAAACYFISAASTQAHRRGLSLGEQL